VNDNRSHRRSGPPAWPSGDDHDASAKAPQERTGFWSPLWEDEDDGKPHVGGRPNGRGAHHARPNGADGSNGHGAHHLPERGAHQASPPPPPRPAPRPAGGPAWPSDEPPPVPPRPAAPGGMNGRPPAGPPTRAAQPRPGGPSRPGGPAGPPGVPDGPTEHLPPVHGYSNPEPQLLTHRELDYDETPYEEPPPVPRQRVLNDDDDGPPLTEDQRRKRRKLIWRRVRRVGYVATALMIIGPMIAFFIAYQMVEVPSPESVRTEHGQVVTLQYSDGTEMGKVVPQGGENRTLVKYDEIPEDVLHAVFAAEDAEFMTNPGFDISGVLRAGWNQVSGGEGGGSTITQQYVKKATGNEEKSLTRKGLEVVTAYKMNNTYTKEDIITAYLNTIYFGRSAYGISAAAKAYYGKSLDKVTASEAALLAGMIQNPSRYKEQDYMERRWNYVMDQMVSNEWVTADERAAAKFPDMADLDKARPQAITGPLAHIQRAAFAELEAAGISEDKLHQKGLTIKTTINASAQKIAARSVNSVMGPQPPEIRPALVAVDPKSGGVLAYYGGKNGVGLDWAAQRQEPGSSFKPFDLVALLKDGKGLAEKYDGTSGRMFPGRKTPVRNSSGASCGTQCTVAEAMERSINTVFYDVAVNTVGTRQVEVAAREAGIVSDLNGQRPDKEAPDGNIAIGGGDTQVSTMEMASAYATFAADGMYRKPHIVAQVEWPDKSVYWSPKPVEKPAFDANDATHNHQIARNVTESLKPVLESSDLECDDGRECAGKTGTHQMGGTEDNAKAWMVGYTPQISAAVSMGAENDKGRQLPLRNEDGGIVYGSGLPGAIWQKFMNDYLAKAKQEPFGEFEPIGEDFRGDDSGDNGDGQDQQNEDEDNNDDDNNDNDKPSRDDQTRPNEPGNGQPDPSDGPDEPTDTQPTEPEFPDPSFPLGNGRPGGG
jgi:membrane peptidoglycan carboxypeptidase